MQALLHALARLQAPAGGFDVLVVDDGSPQPLRPAVPEGLEVRVLRTPTAGRRRPATPGCARRAGTWWPSRTTTACPSRTGWCGSRRRSPHGRGRSWRAGRSADCRATRGRSPRRRSRTHSYERVNADPANARFGASKNLAAPRLALLDAGGFDEHYRASEDRELCARWVEQGRPFVYEPAAVILHRNPRSAGAFWRQHLLYGRGAFHFHRREAGTGLEVDPGDYLAFAREPLTGPRRAGVPRAVVLALVALSQGASALGYGLEAVSFARGRDAWGRPPWRAVA